MLRRWLRLSLGLSAWRLDTGFGNKYRKGTWDGMRLLGHWTRTSLRKYG